MKKNWAARKFGTAARPGNNSRPDSSNTPPSEHVVYNFQPSRSPGQLTGDDESSQCIHKVYMHPSSRHQVACDTLGQDQTSVSQSVVRMKKTSAELDLRQKEVEALHIIDVDSSEDCFLCCVDSDLGGTQGHGIGVVPPTDGSDAARKELEDETGKEEEDVELPCLLQMCPDPQPFLASVFCATLGLCWLV